MFFLTVNEKSLKIPSLYVTGYMLCYLGKQKYLWYDNFIECLMCLFWTPLSRKYNLNYFNDFLISVKCFLIPNIEIFLVLRESCGHKCLSIR